MNYIETVASRQCVKQIKLNRYRTRTLCTGYPHNPKLKKHINVSIPVVRPLQFGEGGSGTTLQTLKTRVG